MKTLRVELMRRFGVALTGFSGSEAYWKSRYKSHGNSGAGSYNRLAEFKADVLNDFVASHQMRTVIEYGCGDGNQLKLAQYPSYVGFDVSPDAIDICQSIFLKDSTKLFKLVNQYAGEKAELTLSLDVIYHLVEDSVFSTYMSRLFDSSTRYVVIYASNTDQQQPDQSPHVRHRCFSNWVETHRGKWRLIQHIPNKYPFSGDEKSGSFADFFIYEKQVNGETRKS